MIPTHCVPNAVNQQRKNLNCVKIANGANHNWTMKNKTNDHGKN